MTLWMCIVVVGGAWLIYKDLQESGPPVDHSNGTCGCHYVDDGGDE